MVTAAVARPRVDSHAIGPPLKWAGGKRWQVPYLLPLWERHDRSRLVEPFCGGLAVALGLSPSRALLNDVNPHLINFYQWLQQGLTIDKQLVKSKVRYYTYRKRFNDLIEMGDANTREAAILFYYLNKTGYNGLCRFNRRGHFNVPFGSHKTITYCRDFSEYRSVLGNWDFASSDFEDLKLRPSDFVYADPPYDVEFTSYSKGGFTWDDQERLARWLAKHDGPVVIANQSTPRIIQLYESLGFALISLKGPRRISCTGDRAPAEEVLGLRNLRLGNGQT